VSPKTRKRTAQDILDEKGTTIHAIPGDRTLHQALEIMLRHGVGSVLVKEEGELVGIWTDRDLMHNAVDPDVDLKKAQVRDYMTRDIPVASTSTDPYELMDKYLGLRVRHLLIKDGKAAVGLLSMGDVVRFCLQDKMREMEELKEEVNWEYFEDWHQRPR